MKQNQYRLNWTVTSFLVVFHLGALVALFFVSWAHIILGLCVWASVCSLGVGIGFHRLITHHGFRTYKVIEYTLATIGTLALQGLPTTWSARHRIHHHNVEKPGLDPHTPLDGKWWSHVDWIIHPDPQLKDRMYLERWVADMTSQTFYRQRYLEWLPTTILTGVIFYFGGIGAVLWGIVMPVVVGWHFTWFVNSITHIWGSRRFDTRDNSRNSWWVAILTFGEGWHNNHHRYPSSPRHGLAWYELDVEWYLIWFSGKIGLTWDFKKIG